MKPYQMANIIDYGDGYVEGSWGTVGIRWRKKTIRGKSKNREENIKRSKARTKAEVRRKCMAMGADHLLTLTYRENKTDKEETMHDVEVFIRKVHEKLPGWKYVMVPERQKRGAIHFHVAVKGFQDVIFLRNVWRETVAEGNIDIKYKEMKAQNGKWKKGNSYTWGKADLATYLAKYITKEPEEESRKIEIQLNERRYRTSLGILIPIKRTVIPWVIRGKRKTVFLKAKDYVLEKIGYIEGERGYLWEPEEGKGFHGWGCSWGYLVKCTY